MKIIKTIGNVKHKDKQTIITIPATLFKGVKYVEIEINDETLVLKPVKKDRVELGIEQDINNKKKTARVKRSWDYYDWKNPVMRYNNSL